MLLLGGQPHTMGVKLAALNACCFTEQPRVDDVKAVCQPKRSHCQAGGAEHRSEQQQEWVRKGPRRLLVACLGCDIDIMSLAPLLLPLGPSPGSMETVILFMSSRATHKYPHALEGVALVLCVGLVLNVRCSYA